MTEPSSSVADDFETHPTGHNDQKTLESGSQKSGQSDRSFVLDKQPPTKEE